MAVNIADMDGVGTEREHAENRSFAGSRTWGGEICSMVWTTIWMESANSNDISRIREDSVEGVGGLERRKLGCSGLCGFWR